jgi:hypothetical protein
MSLTQLPSDLLFQLATTTDEMRLPLVETLYRVCRYLRTVLSSHLYAEVRIESPTGKSNWRITRNIYFRDSRGGTVFYLSLIDEKLKEYYRVRNAMTLGVYNEHDGPHSFSMIMGNQVYITPPDCGDADTTCEHCLWLQRYHRVLSAYPFLQSLMESSTERWTVVNSESIHRLDLIEMTEPSQLELLY